MAIWIVRRRDNLEMPAIEGVGRIGHFEAIAGTIRVVEGGINIRYRSRESCMAPTASRLQMP